MAKEKRSEDPAEQPDDTVVVWEPQAGPQTALLTCPVFEVFYGGARGGGKTDGMLGEFVSHADQYGEHAIGLMVRRERTQLIETIERSKVVYTQLGAKYHEQDKMWRFPNGARLRFAYLERDADADAYQGHSYTRVYVEEIGTFPSPVPIMKLMATLRSGAGVPCGFRATGNPGGPGHSWVKTRYIDPAPAGWAVITSEFTDPWSQTRLTKERVYIPSRLNDNTYLGGEYVANLFMSGSEKLVKAWLEGDWDVVDGAFFDNWSSAKHVIRPFEIPAGWTRIRAGDWGSARPFCFGWYAIVTDTYQTANGLILPRGCLVKYREWYGVKSGKDGGFEPNIGLKLTAEDVAAGIKERQAKDEKIADSVLDPATFAENGGKSIAERMMNDGAWFREADNTRVAGKGALSGWDQVRSRLNGDEDGNPMLVFFSTCTHSIRTIPALQHDTLKPEDIDTDGEDHAADETRYACNSRPWARVASNKPKTKPDDRYSKNRDGSNLWRAA